MVAGAAFLGRLGPDTAKNTAPVNFLAPERGFFGVQREPHFWAVSGLIGPKIRLPSISWPQRGFFGVQLELHFLGRLGPNRAKNTAPVNFLAPERGFFGVQREPQFWAV